MAVEYSLNAFRRSNFVRGGGAIQFATDTDPRVALEPFRAAARAAEAPHDAAAEDGEDFVASSAYSPAPGGPIGYMHICDNGELLATWLSSVANRLEGEGHAGELRIVKDVEGPKLNAPTAVAGITLCPEYGELLAAPLDWGNPPLRWWVSPDRTARVVPALVAWCLDTPGEVTVRAAIGLPLDPVAAEEFVLGALNADTSTCRSREQRRLPPPVPDFRRRRRSGVRDP
ncbi:MAG: hypothetical protein JWN68_752 [Nocardioides sp.]|jgi:hypothetical protein|uniref:hypothetical protein n=1 Tax=Nocardioides sp. TaxID=35761 RepID=UPI0026023865|nr:hypothetical protein [Nocardioides sp.]MCW2832799.1 hypothetical protein [Nocardioides sp.]